MGSVLPESAPAVLNVLLDDAFLPSGSNIAEVGIEQVVRGHRRKALINDPRLALLDLVHRGLHVVVDATPCNAAQGGEGSRVGVEQHLMALHRVSLDDKHFAEAQFEVRCHDLAPDATDHQVFFAPVKLVCLTRFELQRDKGARYRVTITGMPATDIVRHCRVAASVSLRLDGVKERQSGAPIAARTVGIDFQRPDQFFLESAQLAGFAGPLVFGLRSQRNLQPLLYRRSRQPCPSRYFRPGLAVPEKHPANSTEHLHGDHPFSLLHKNRTG